jgi:hypothetical protein
MNICNSIDSSVYYPRCVDGVEVASVEGTAERKSDVGCETAFMYALGVCCQRRTKI